MATRRRIIAESALSVSALRTLLKYDPDTGLLTWLDRPFVWFSDVATWRSINTRYAGKKAGSVTDQGYLSVMIGGCNIRGHRIAWALHYGNWPQHIDHINGDRLDNRIENLREVDRAENMKNMRMPADNTSGFVGVTRHYEKWKAQITVNGKHIYLGRFDHKKDAIAARIAANRKFGFHENHGSRA